MLSKALPCSCLPPFLWCRCPPPPAPLTLPPPPPPQCHPLCPHLSCIPSSPPSSPPHSICQSIPPPLHFTPHPTSPPPPPPAQKSALTPFLLAGQPHRGQGGHPADTVQPLLQGWQDHRVLQDQAARPPSQDPVWPGGPASCCRAAWQHEPVCPPGVPRQVQKGSSPSVSHRQSISSLCVGGGGGRGEGGEGHWKFRKVACLLSVTGSQHQVRGCVCV